MAKVGLAKVGLAKVGRITMAKVGLAKVGFDRCWTGEIGKVDGFEETRRGGEGDRRGCATSCGEDNGKAVAKKAEEATAPFQHALTTKAGCECIAHILQTSTDLDNRATVVSIDGVGRTI